MFYSILQFLFILASKLPDRTAYSSCGLLVSFFILSKSYISYNVIQYRCSVTLSTTTSFSNTPPYGIRHYLICHYPTRLSYRPRIIFPYIPLLCFYGLNGLILLFRDLLFNILIVYLKVKFYRQMHFKNITHQLTEKAKP